MVLLFSLLVFTFAQQECHEGLDSCEAKLDTAVFAAGCFWEVEHVFGELDGVLDAKSGFMGGNVGNPSYREVYTDNTGHAEVVEVKFDPTKISYEQLLETYWDVHDPTQLNRQGVDIGTRYRTEIFYMDEEQKKKAEESMQSAMPRFHNEIVTQISPASQFYEAEDYHQDYFKKHPDQR